MTKKTKFFFAKNELRHIAYSSFKTYNSKDHKFENISKREHKAFLELLDLKDLIIQKADKGNVIMIIDRNVYITKMNNILNDDTKFVKILFGKRNKELDYLLDKQDKIVALLKNLRDSRVITDSVLNNLKPCGSQPGVLSGYAKFIKVVMINHHLSGLYCLLLTPLPTKLLNFSFPCSQS